MRLWSVLGPFMLYLSYHFHSISSLKSVGTAKWHPKEKSRCCNSQCRLRDTTQYHLLRQSYYRTSVMHEQVDLMVYIWLCLTLNTLLIFSSCELFMWHLTWLNWSHCLEGLGYDIICIILKELGLAEPQWKSLPVHVQCHCPFHTAWISLSRWIIGGKGGLTAESQGIDKQVCQF